MTFKELYIAARKLCPSEYVSITASLHDHWPGRQLPTYQWSIYSVSFGHFAADTPERALALLESKINNQQVTVSQVDI